MTTKPRIQIPTMRIEIFEAEVTGAGKRFQLLRDPSLKSLRLRVARALGVPDADVELVLQPEPRDGAST